MVSWLWYFHTGCNAWINCSLITNSNQGTRCDGASNSFSSGLLHIDAGITLPSSNKITCFITSFSMASDLRSEEHTSELQSLMRTSYAVFCLKKTNQTPKKK